MHRSRTTDSTLPQERLNALLDAVESEKIAPYQIGATRRDLLVTHKNAAIPPQAMADLIAFLLEGS